MGFFSPAEVLDILGDKAQMKKKLSFIKLFLLSILGGSFIAEGFLACIRVQGTMPAQWGSFATFLGGCLFPIGLMAIVLVGGELATGNMMTMAIGLFQKKISFWDLTYNWVVVMAGNMVGSIIVAYSFGHFVGLTEGAFLAKTMAVANSKISDPPMVALVSAIGCNIFVCMAVWFATSAKDFTAKMAGMWFPIMIFVVLGFQHVVANAFVIPAAIFSGESSITWFNYLQNTVFVFIGNAIGGALVFALPCFCMYGQKENVKTECEVKLNERKGNFNGYKGKGRKAEDHPTGWSKAGKHFGNFN
ncbi:MAG: formate/nitrite transporter family protein [Lachnospiraceae bacterium]|nr:formate/nitrite transporter family protein [Lachnospiraceae bacterium]